MPTIERYMTKQPWTVGRDATVTQARRLMLARHIRHLPVVEGDRLVGLVTDRDLRYSETLPVRQGEALTVEEVMVTDVFAVPATAPADDVVERMAERKCGSAVILDHGGAVAGIFTANDALQFFAEVLRRASV